MKVGFTGTGTGMSLEQFHHLGPLLALLGATELHQGDCVGADLAANHIATARGIRTVQHPPTNNKARAFTVCDEYREPKPYLVRNGDIVDETEILIACPATAQEQLRSGTWATVRCARKLGRRTIIINPDGTMIDNKEKMK